MKKALLIIAIIVICLVNITRGYAVSNVHHLVYDIESFSINEDTGEIIFEGWAFLDAYHNYGGSNTKIEISANNKVTKEAVYNKSRDQSLYQANCIRNEKGICHQSYENATCSTKNSMSSCRYDNVSFTIKFTIAELLEKIGPNKEINFQLKVTNSEHGATKTSDIAVYEGAANGLKNDMVIEGTETKVTVSGISTTAKIIDGAARVQASPAGDRAYGPRFYWAENNIYEIKDVQYSTASGKESIKMYALKYNFSKNTYNLKNCDPAGKYGCKSGKAIPGNSETGWAYSSWLVIHGSVKIVLGEVEKPNNCAVNEYSNTDNDLNCDEEATFEEVISEDINLTRTISPGDSNYSRFGKYSSYHQGGPTADYLGCTDELVIQITGKNTIKQNGVALFGLSDREIYAGGGFNFTSSYAGQATYEVCEPLTFTVTDTETYSWCSRGHECGFNTCCETETEEIDEDKDGKVDYTNEYDVVIGSMNHICQDYVSSKITIDSSDVSSYEMKQVTEHMQTLLEEPKDNATTLSLDSNEVGSSTMEIGSWTDSYKNDTDGDNLHWNPGEAITYDLEFTLDRACINRKSAKVRYVRTGQECSDDEIDGGELYYIPLKQESGGFPVLVTIDDLNVLKERNWDLNYECDANCQQKLYDVTGNGSFKFIYRPISLSNPFPGREPGNNWIYFMEDTNAIKNKLNRKTLEYEITLGPNEISSIKNYNKNSKYTNLNTITNGGNSLYLDTLSFDTQTINYNKLGECTKDCWAGSLLYESGDN